jgi:tyrosine-specific transport protein
MSRLFSNLEFREEGLQHSPGSVWGCTALVAGTTVGAGMLALPAVTMAAGLIPSSVMLVGVWLYALATALLIVEVNLQTLCVVGRPGLGLLAMIDCTLGQPLACMAGGAYLFLHYALLVAYVAQGGDVLATALRSHFFPHLPTWVGLVIFAIALGGFVLWGRSQWVETLNTILVGMVILSFLGLLLLGSQQTDLTQVTSPHWRLITPAVPVMLVALFYHNVIPVVTTRLEGDRRQIRQAVAVGSAIALLMFLAWNAVILGSTHPDQAMLDPLQILHAPNDSRIGSLMRVFAEVAIATSFIGFIYGLLDLFQDLWASAPRPIIDALILLPTLALAILNPTIFLTALDAAGTFSITILGGIFPTIMAWKQRHQNSTMPPLLPGGTVSLLVLLIFSVSVMVIHLL